MQAAKKRQQQQQLETEEEPAQQQQHVIVQATEIEQQPPQEKKPVKGNLRKEEDSDSEKSEVIIIIPKQNTTSKTIAQSEDHSTSFSFSNNTKRKREDHLEKIRIWNETCNGLGDLIHPFVSIKRSSSNSYLFSCNVCCDEEPKFQKLDTKQTIVQHLTRKCSRKNVQDSEISAFQIALEKIKENVNKRKKPVKALISVKELIKQHHRAKAQALTSYVGTFFNQVKMKGTEEQLTFLKSFMKEVVNMANHDDLVDADFQILQLAHMGKELGIVQSHNLERRKRKRLSNEPRMAKSHKSNG